MNKQFQLYKPLIEGSLSFYGSWLMLYQGLQVVWQSMKEVFGYDQYYFKIGKDLRMDSYGGC